MKPFVSNLLKSIAATGIIALAITAIIIEHQHPLVGICPDLKIVITDTAQRQYVSERELSSILRDKKLYPVGKPINEVATAEIEAEIKAHPMVRKAECYMLSDGKTYIEVTQRRPILRIVNGGESYLIDTERKQMPIRPGMRLKVLTASGNIGIRMAQEELYDLVNDILANDYWRERINGIQVKNPKQVYLSFGKNQQILLGSVDHHNEKLNRLQTLYEKGFDKLGQDPEGKTFDLRFRKQVIVR